MAPLMRAFARRSVSPPARAMTDTFCPKRSPPRPQLPVFAVIRRGGLQFGHNISADAATAPAIGGIARHEGPTRRRHPARGLHVMQNPHQCRDIERVSRAGRKPHTPQCPAQTNVARSFSLSFFEHTRKRCNFNDLYSQLEAPPGELRATLPESINVAQNDDYPQCMATTFPYRSS